MPPGAAVLAVSRGFESDRALLVDDGLDLAILDRFELHRADRAPRALSPCARNRGTAQQAADVIGPKRRRTSHGHAVRVSRFGGDVARYGFLRMEPALQDARDCSSD